MKAKNLHEDQNAAQTTIPTETSNPTAPEPGEQHEARTMHARVASNTTSNSNPTAPEQEEQGPTAMQIVKRPVSQAKLNANRKNAKRSTGPRTPAGKRRVRWNALKHGLLTRDIVAYWENQEEYDALLDALVKDCKPVGATEFLSVKKMADAYWQDLRAQRYEKGETFLRWREAWKGPNIAHANKRSNESGQMVVFLEELSKEVRTSNSISDRSMADLCELFKDDSRFLEPFLTIRGEGKKSWSGNEPMYLIAPEQKKDMLQAIKNQRGFLSCVWDHWDEESDRNAEVLNAVAGLLPPPYTDNLIRYRTFADRSFHRASDQLERLQRRRKGEFVPPPVKAHLSLEK